MIVSPAKAKAAQRRRVVIENKDGQKLVGILHDAGSKELIIVCHGFRSWKERIPMVNIAASVGDKGISTFRFDFAGNGESEGSFQYGNYWSQVEDLRAVIQHFRGEERVPAIVGHSKGGNVVLLYASKYKDVNTVINISGRFDLKRGIEGRLGKDYLQRIKQNGYIDVSNREGKFQYRATVESLMDRLSTDTLASCLQINPDCRVLTIHGTKDEMVPVEDASQFAKFTPNHKLRIIDGADHEFTTHQDELVSVVLEFLSESLPSISGKSLPQLDDQSSRSRL